LLLSLTSLAHSRCTRHEPLEETETSEVNMGYEGCFISLIVYFVVAFLATLFVYSVLSIFFTIPDWFPVSFFITSFFGIFCLDAKLDGGEK
jgi:hypothetical protein